MEQHAAKTATLDIAYLQWGSSEARAIFLLHGFPDDAFGWSRVGEMLAAAGWRAIAPYSRGVGATTFRNPSSRRTGQREAVAQDVIDLADALKIETFALIGHDQGAQAAQIVAAFHPQRVTKLTLLSGFGIYTIAVSRSAPRLASVLALWYQAVLISPIGEMVLRYWRKPFAKILWRLWSPTWTFTDVDFERTAQSFENPDYPAVVTSSYRVGYGVSPKAPQYNSMLFRPKDPPKISVPTHVMIGDADPLNVPQETLEDQQRFFAAEYTVSYLHNVGHFVQREAPVTVTESLTSHRSFAE